MCKHEWVFDWENPPGYICKICKHTCNACEFCEEPTTHRFCSEMCASEYEAWFDPIEDDNYIDDVGY